ncbi:MAG: hypothetical protein AAF787_04690 [Chloroflexota bacterium]
MSLSNRINNTNRSQRVPGASNRANAQQNNSPFGQRPSRFSTRNTNLNLGNVITPLDSTLVRFSLHGMGDPFYRLLGREMNPDYGNLSKLAEALRKGGEAVDELIDKLNIAWEGYKLEGAMLVYNEDADVLEALKKPTPVPQLPQQQRRQLRGRNNNNDDEEEEAEEKQPDWYQTSNYRVDRLRSIDLTLTLNVLARARSQVIIAQAPVVFGIEYLTRSVITDDPRFVSLAKATGSLPDA